MPVKLLRHSSITQEGLFTPDENKSLDSSSCDAPLTDLHFTLSTEEISSLNDLTWNQMNCQALEEATADFKEMATFTVLFITHDISLLPLQALRLGAGAVCVVSKNPTLQRILTAIAAENSMPTDRLEFLRCVEDVEGKWDILIADVLECSGSLHPQILEEIALCR